MNDRDMAPAVEFLELPSYQRTANLPAMDADLPSRMAAKPIRVLSPDSRGLPHSRENPAAGVGDCRPPLDEGSAGASKDRGPDREERLLRYVDILRTDQVLASIEANEEEGGKTGFRQSRGLVLALAVIAMAVAAAFLLASGARHLHFDAVPNSVVRTTSVHSASERDHVIQRDMPPQSEPTQPPDGVAEVEAPTEKPIDRVPSRPLPEALPPDNPLTPGPTIAEQQVADPPNMTKVARQPTAVPSQLKSSNVLPPRHQEGAPASGAPIRTAAEVSESETAKPVLWVYYPSGSSRAETNARSLLARSEPNLTRSDAEAQTDLPDEAVIKFSEERNHALARIIGKSLGTLGYRWRIENAAGLVDTPRNMIEVWLPS